MFDRFRTHYPQGSFVSELVTVESGKYVVRAIAQVAGEMLATSLAAAETVEQAEDKARGRLLEFLDLAAATPSPTKLGSDILSSPPLPTVASPPPPQKLETTETVAPKVDPPPTEPEPKTVSPTLDFPPASPEPEPQVEIPAVASFETAEPPISATEKVPEPSPAADRAAKKSAPAAATQETPATPIDFSDIIAKTNLEIKRLQWTQEQGKEYLLATYGKRSRQLLTDGELLEFLEHLQQQPIP